MTVHALLAHLEELSRLKVHVLYQRLAKDSVACSTRSAPLDLLSALPSANSMSAASGSALGVRKKVAIIFLQLPKKIRLFCIKDEVRRAIDLNVIELKKDSYKYLLKCAGKRCHTVRVRCGKRLSQC